MLYLLKKTKGAQLWLLAIAVLLSFSSFVSNHRGSKTTGLGVKRIVIDAGHGGNDPGNIGTGRYKKSEKDIALHVALELGDYIQRAYPDVDIIYTRKEDKFVTLNDRTKIANKAQADLFISIHCNSGENKEAAGTETFVMSLGKSQANLELAKRENSVIMMEENYEQVYAGFDPNNPVSSIQMQIAQSVHLDNSLNLSAKIQDQYRIRVGRKDRGVKQAGFYVISFTTMPSVLTEIGFLTNREEEDFLISDNGKTYIASAIYRAFKEYKSEIEGVEIVTPEFEKHIPEAQEKQTQTITVVTENSTTQTVVQTVNNTPTPASTPAESVIYKIQLRSSKEKVALTPNNFNGLEGVKEYEVEGIFKYTLGEVTDYKKAVSLQRTVREKAFADAFIIAFYNGERIPISRALEISKAQ